MRPFPAAGLMRYHDDVQQFGRITMDRDVMGGEPCIRGMRVTVGTIVEAVSAGRTVEQLLADFPHLEEADIREALAFAARVVEKREVSGEDLPRVAIAWTEGELNGLGELLSVS